MGLAGCYCKPFAKKQALCKFADRNILITIIFFCSPGLLVKNIAKKIQIDYIYIGFHSLA
jgi:hypothetical protein